MVDISIDFTPTGSVIMISSRNPVTRTKLMEITVTDYVPQLRRITSVIDSSLIIDFAAYIGNFTEFYYMIISMKKNSHAGSVVDIAFAYPVAYTVYPDSRSI